MCGLASKGYPGSYKTGKAINNLNKVENIEGIEVFHAGTKSDSSIVKSNGGRVLSITATGKDLNLARSRHIKPLKLLDGKAAFTEMT